jgi:large subunit ribosomal protein L19
VSDELLKKAVAYSMKENVPQFDIGDTVSVHVKIVEGSKERVQKFTGTVIARRGSGISETFTVRRVVNNRGVERVFPVHSTHVVDVEVLRSGRTRRAKLYYLRDRVGKATRLQEIRQETGANAPKSEAEEELPAAEGPVEEEVPEEEPQEEPDEVDQLIEELEGKPGEEEEKEE